LIEKFNLNIEKEEDKKLVDLYFDKIIQLSFQLPKKNNQNKQLEKYVEDLFSLPSIDENFVDLFEY
jgi:hypothetical protein